MRRASVVCSQHMQNVVNKALLHSRPPPAHLVPDCHIQDQGNGTMKKCLLRCVHWYLMSLVGSLLGVRQVLNHVTVTVTVSTADVTAFNAGRRVQQQNKQLLAPTCGKQCYSLSKARVETQRVAKQGNVGRQSCKHEGRAGELGRSRASQPACGHSLQGLASLV